MTCASRTCSCPGTASSPGRRGNRDQVSRRRRSCRARGSSAWAPARRIWGARRALDEARKELTGKSDRYTGQPLLENPATQRALETAEGLWFACRAGLREALSAIWEDAVRGNAPTAETAVNARVAAVTAAQKGAEIVRAAYDAAGASAIGRGGVLQKLLRDASCLTHHVSANMASLEQTGRVRSGIGKVSFRI